MSLNILLSQRLRLNRRNVNSGNAIRRFVTCIDFKSRPPIIGPFPAGRGADVLRTNRILADHGLPSHAPLSHLRSPPSRQPQGSSLLLPRPVFLHGLRAITWASASENQGGCEAAHAHGPEGQLQDAIFGHFEDGEGGSNMGLGKQLTLFN